MVLRPDAAAVKEQIKTPADEHRRGKGDGREYTHVDPGGDREGRRLDPATGNLYAVWQDGRFSADGQAKIQAALDTAG